MVNLNECKKGDRLLSKHGWILTYVKKLPEENYFDHLVRYPDGSGGTRTNEGMVARNRPLPTDHDIVYVLK